MFVFKYSYLVDGGLLFYHLTYAQFGEGGFGDSGSGGQGSDAGGGFAAVDLVSKGKMAVTLVRMQDLAQENPEVYLICKLEMW